jgi:hypothetical protein
MVLVIIIIGGTLTYFLSVPLDTLILKMEGTFPSIFTGNTWNLFKALNDYKLFFLVLLPLLIWIIVNNQQPKEGAPY